MMTPRVIASSSGAHHASATSNIVGGRFRVGKKIGEGSFGVVFEGASLPSERCFGSHVTYHLWGLDKVY